MSEFTRAELLDNTKWSAEKVFELFDEDKGKLKEKWAASNLIRSHY